MYPDELEADFRQYYGLYLYDMGRSFSFKHGSLLAAQLPAGARVHVAKDPNQIWTSETWFLRRIEYELAGIVSAFSKGKQKPQIMDTPAQALKIQQSMEKTNFAYIAQVLGVEYGGDS